MTASPQAMRRLRRLCRPRRSDAPGYIAEARRRRFRGNRVVESAAAKSASADVKKFAQMMIDNHANSTAKVKAAAAEAKLEVASPKLDADQQRDARRDQGRRRRVDRCGLSGASGADRRMMRRSPCIRAMLQAGIPQASKKAAETRSCPWWNRHRTELGKLAAKGWHE